MSATKKKRVLRLSDCELLGETLRETGARLVVIDPLLAVLGTGGGINGPLVRASLGRLARVAEETRAAVIMVRHLTKGGRGQRAIYRGSGSIAVIGAARTAFLVGPHPEDNDVRVLACTKNNLTQPPATLSFRITANDRGEATLTWTGAVDLSADDLVLTPLRPPAQALRQAREFLETLLRGGPCRAEQAFQQAEAAGIARRTLQRAKADLRVVSEVELADGERHWSWHLPGNQDSLSWSEKQQRAIEEAQKENDAILAQLRAKYGSSSKYGPMKSDGSS